MALSIDEIQEKIDALETALAARASSGASGVVSVTIDGTTTQYKFADAIAELKFWETRLTKLSSNRKPVRTIDLRGA